MTKGNSAKVDLYHFVKDVTGSRWAYTQTVSWEKYQELAKTLKGEGETWKAELVR